MDKTYRAKLFKVSSSHKNLRTDTMEGECLYLPEVGKRFVIGGPPLNPDASVRCIYTAPVKAVVRCDNTFVFKTENSTYCLDILEGL